jgi:hypothetical protein
MQQLSSSKVGATCISSGAAFVLALVSSGVGITQIATAQASQQTTTTTSSPVASVYVQTKKGIDVFSASSTGRLTQVKGSLFADTGQMGAINGSWLVSVGTDDMHVYPIETSGGVGKQVSEINTQTYGGSQCGTNNGGALFDHTGKYLYVQLLPPNGGDSSCSAVQSYKIGSNGELTFLGDELNDSGYHGQPSDIGISTISGSDTLGNGVYNEVYANAFSAFTRESSGAMMTNGSFTETDPKPNPNVNSNFFPLYVAADPTNHLAALMYYAFAQSSLAPQLASYTIQSNGSIVSTNTWENMPAPAISVGAINMSPSGKQLAVAGTGVEIYNFNGASPITLASSLPNSSVHLSQLAWDKNNHLFAIDEPSGNLYVYTITGTSITPVSGSPYTIPDNANSENQYDLIVVPK